MSLTHGVKQSGSVMAALYRRYAEWLVSITWKRFIVLSLLLLIVTGMLSNLPPFNWDLATRTTHVPASRTADITVDDHGVRIKPKRKGSQAPEITIDEHGVRIKREGDSASGKPPQEIIVDEHGVQMRRDPQASTPPTPPAAPSTKHDAAGVAEEITQELAQDIRREVIDAIGEMGDEERVVHVRLGNYLPQLAFLVILLSAAIKIAYAGRVKAEAKAAEAQEVAEAESLKRQVVEARMAAMQAQVEPHFLFNTLATIDHLIEVDPPRASRMQKNLIALLRASMPMMLQSLVENAIKHGLEPKADGGSLTVSAEVAHGKLHVSVADTGVGFARAATAGTGTGLTNIRERLKLIYGDAAQLRARLSELWPELEIVAEAKNGVEAVEQVAALRPEVVFLDIRMPAKTGIEAAREIAALDGRLPEIVFVTAYDQYAIDAFQQGVIDYVLKPAERERLGVTGRAAAGARQPGGETGAGVAAEVDPGLCRRPDPDDPGRRRAVLRLRREIHARADRAAGSAHQEAHQGAPRRARPPAVLADPPLDADQRARHRRHRPRRARAPARGGQGKARDAGGQPQLRPPVQRDVTRT